VVISLHGRTLQQGYKGDADWDAIARAVQLAHHSETLILGNGDVADLAEASRRVRASGVDGVLLGRAAQGNPWLFAAKDRFKNEPADDPAASDGLLPGLAERFRVMLAHCRHYEHRVGPRHFVAMRKHLTWYCRNFRGAAELRARLTRVQSAEEVAACLFEFRASRDHEAPDGAAGTREKQPADLPASALAPWS
jgi:tRNA-dihydrouridine synthase